MNPSDNDTFRQPMRNVTHGEIQKLFDDLSNNSPNAYKDFFWIGVKQNKLEEINQEDAHKLKFIKYFKINLKYPTKRYLYNLIEHSLSHENIQNTPFELASVDIYNALRIQLNDTPKI